MSDHPTEHRLKDGRIATLRRATPDDAEAITRFVDLIGSERRYVLRERATWTLEEERRTLSSADGRDAVFLIAEIDGQLSGLLNVARGRSPKNAHVAEFGMSCHPECRRIGLGTALLERALDWARSVGIRKMNLEVFASNSGAIALYRKMGFEEEGRRRGEFIIDGVPVDGILMARWLDRTPKKF